MFGELPLRDRVVSRWWIRIEGVWSSSDRDDGGNISALLGQSAESHQSTDAVRVGSGVRWTRVIYGGRWCACVLTSLGKNIVSIEQSSRLRAPRRWSSLTS